jgi:hypothetical protein
MQRSSISGCVCLKRAMRGSSHHVAVAVEVDSVTLSAALPICRTSRSAWSTSVSPSATCSCRYAPAAVVCTPLWRRSNSMTPSEVSS